MNVLRRIAAFIYGFGLMYLVSVWLAGFMAARSVPLQYFGFFSSHGPLGKEAGLALLSVWLHLVPAVVLLMAGAFAAVAACAKDRRRIGVAVLLGAAASYAFWMMYYAATSGEEPGAFALALARYVQAPWWAWPAIVAPVLGLVLAYMLLPRPVAARSLT